MSIVRGIRQPTRPGGHVSDRFSAQPPGDATLYHDVVKSLPVAMIVTDAFGGIRYLNAAAERLLDYRSREVFGWALAVLLTLRNGGTPGIGGDTRFLTLERRRGGTVQVRIRELELPVSLGKGYLLRPSTSDSEALDTRVNC